MDHRQAVMQGIQIHTRQMSFARGYVNCVDCACNYSGDMSPTFCQIYSMPVDPTATEVNIEQAEQCKQWVLRGMDRNKVIMPDHTYHYEKYA